MQHNDIADPENDTGSLNTAMTQIIQAIRGHPALKYLDISATELKSKNFKNLLYYQSKGHLNLENLQCRKNGINGDEIKDVFKVLKHNTFLKVINLQDNFINDENAKEILNDYAMINIYLENVTLKGNKSLNSSI